MRKFNSKGFTLMEVMAVIFMIAILVAAAMPSYIDNLNKTRFNEAKAAMQKAAQANYTFGLQYPAHRAKAAGKLDNSMGGGTACSPKDAAGPKILVDCEYLTNERFGSLAYDVYACDGATGGGCCADGAVACMTSKKDNTKKYTIGSDMEPPEDPV